MPPPYQRKQTMVRRWWAGIRKKMPRFFSEDVELAQYLKKGLTGSFLIQMATILLTFIGNLLLARWMGAEEFGKYTFMLAWLAVATNAFSLGMDDLALKEVPSLVRSPKTDKFFPFVSYAFVRTGISIFIGFGIGFWIFLQSDFFSDWLLAAYFSPILVAFPFGVGILLFQGFLKGGQHILSGQLPEKIVRPAGILGFSVLIFTYFQPNGNIGAAFLWATTASIIIACLLAGWLFFKKFQKWLVLKNPQRVDRKKWNNELWYFFSLSLLSILHARIDVLLLGVLGYIDESGIYQTAARIVDLPLIILLIVHTVIAPLFARLWVENKKDVIQKIFTAATRVVFLLSLPVYLFLTLFRLPLLQLFGDEFQSGSSVLLILVLVQIIVLALGPAAYALMMVGQGKKVTIALVISFGATLAFQLIFIPAWGIEGAALGRGLGLLIGGLLYARMLLKETGIRPGFFSHFKK